MRARKGLTIKRWNVQIISWIRVTDTVKRELKKAAQETVFCGHGTSSADTAQENSCHCQDQSEWMVKSGSLQPLSPFQKT